MSTMTETLFQAALKLPLNEREALRDAITEACVDDDLSPELEATITRRIAGVRSGTVQAINGEEFFQQLRAEAT